MSDDLKAIVECSKSMGKAVIKEHEEFIQELDNFDTDQADAMEIFEIKIRRFTEKLMEINKLAEELK